MTSPTGTSSPAWAGRLDARPEGKGTVLDHCCSLWLSNRWAGWKHDNMKMPELLAGGLGGTIERAVRSTICTLATITAGCAACICSFMDRMGVKLDRFDGAERRLARL